MKTLIVILALVIGTTVGVNAQTQTQTQTKPHTMTHATSQPMAQTQTQPQSQSKTMIKNSELSKPIQDNLAVQFKGWTPVQAYKLDSKGVLSYEVIVRKEQNEMRVYYDKEGKFVREEPLAAMKPATKKEVAPVKPSSKPK